MDILVVGLLVLCACYLGYIMGRGREITLPTRMRKAVRTEAQEADLIDKQFKNNVPIKKG